MPVVVDTHLHLYPCYDRVKLLQSLIRGLRSVAPGAQAAACLVDGAGSAGYRNLTKATAGDCDGVSVRTLPNGDAAIVRCGDLGRVVIVAGRQIVTREKIEILALGTRQTFANGLDAAQTVEDILTQGALPVVSWAPGKWFFKRGRVVSSLLERFRPDQLLIGDTHLRPTVWPRPRLMKRAARMGFRTVCGSDPLPIIGEETRAGAYATAFTGKLDEEDPTASFKRLLLLCEPYCTVGRRDTIVSVVRRLKRHAGRRRERSGDPERG